MKYIFFFLIVSTLISCSTEKANAQKYTVKVTDEMIASERERCLDKYQLQKVEDEIKSLDTLSIDEIKENLKKRYNYFKNNKVEIIKIYRDRENSHEEEFKKITRFYDKKEERFSEEYDLYSRIINTNHLQYRDSLQRNKYFTQFFENGNSSFKMNVRNNGSTIFKFSSEKTIYPYYATNEHTSTESKITNIYYHDEVEKEVPISFESYVFPLNPIQVPKQKHIDSLEIDFNLKYLKSIDTVRFSKEDIGVEKKGITLLEMRDNYVKYKVPYNYYGMYKGRVLETQFFNDEGKVIQNKYGLDNTDFETPEELYKKDFDYNRSVYFSTKNIYNRKDLYKTLTYFSHRYTNGYLEGYAVNRNALKGNVSSFKVYLENERDSILYPVMFHNSSTVQKLYLHELKEKTEFIDKNGNVLIEIPNEINFLYNSLAKKYSRNYFTITVADRRDVFYFLDRDSVNYIKLPYNELSYACPSLLMARSEGDLNFYLVSATENKKLLQDKISNFRLLRYLEKAIVVSIGNEDYYILDQSKNVITPYTDTPITKVYLKKYSYY